MSISLRDQLLKAGLVNQKQAKQVSKDKQKQQRLAHKGQVELDDSQQRAAQEAMAEKVKRLSVNTLMRNKLSNGSLAIVHHAGGYEVIPREAALKIQERDPQRIVQLNVKTEEVAAEDDPYAAYQIPDDVMW
jgi:uncharacterized protein YaiL (DUF2058 family)